MAIDDGVLTGKTLGLFEVGTLLGKGGMGEVYRARDVKLGREVALKVLPEALARDAERIERFKREARVLASLDHPNIGALHDFQEAEGTHFLVMQIVEGDTLEDRLERGKMAIGEALPIFIQIAEALEAAHAAVSSTGISSRPTLRSRMTGGSRCSTLASPGASRNR